MKVLREINVSLKTQTGGTLVSTTKLKSPVIIKEGSLHSAFASFTSEVAAAVVKKSHSKSWHPNAWRIQIFQKSPAQDWQEGIAWGVTDYSCSQITSLHRKSLKSR